MNEFLPKDTQESLLALNGKMKLLLDFCNFDDESLEVFTHLSTCLSIVESGIIAVSSGAGSFITNITTKSRLQSVLCAFTRIDMHPFHRYEAKHYIRNGIFKYKKLKPFTGSNPLLLSHAFTCTNIHEARAKVQDQVIEFLSNHWKRACGLHEQYLQSLENTTYLLHAATERIPVDPQVYYSSFVYQQMICYVTKIKSCSETNKEMLHIKLNFPLLPEIIKKDLRTELKQQSPVNLYKYPAVRGYI